MNWQALRMRWFGRRTSRRQREGRSSQGRLGVKNCENLGGVSTERSGLTIRIICVGQMCDSRQRDGTGLTITNYWSQVLPRLDQKQSKVIRSRAAPGPCSRADPMVRGCEILKTNRLLIDPTAMTLATPGRYCYV